MPSDQITIRLPDGSTRDVATGTTAGDLAAAIGRNLRKAAVIANVNGVERDLVWPLQDGDDWTRLDSARLALAPKFGNSAPAPRYRAPEPARKIA